MFYRDEMGHLFANLGGLIFFLEKMNNNNPNLAAKFHGNNQEEGFCFIYLL